MLTAEQKKMTRAEKEREAMKIMSELPESKQNALLIALLAYLDNREKRQTPHQSCD